MLFDSIFSKSMRCFSGGVYEKNCYSFPVDIDDVKDVELLEMLVLSSLAFVTGGTDTTAPPSHSSRWPVICR